MSNMVNIITTIVWAVILLIMDIELIESLRKLEPCQSAAHYHTYEEPIFNWRFLRFIFRLFSLVFFKYRIILIIPILLILEIIIMFIVEGVVTQKRKKQLNKII